MPMSEYQSGKSGIVAKFVGLVPRRGVNEEAEYSAFLPNHLPPGDATYSNAVTKELGAASRMLGELRSMSRELSPFLASGICSAFLKKEAQLSSQIEGTIVPMSDLFLIEPADSQADSAQTEEVRNFDRAQHVAIKGIREGRPLSQSLLKEAHRQLLHGVRGSQWHPGEYRRMQNMIGSQRDIESASYVPPPVAFLDELMENLFEFIAAPIEYDPLVACGLAHYQFEAIHPFEDGNGRIGRLLIILLLIKYGLLDNPFIYMSAFFERTREEYVARLRRVSSHGEWNEWLTYFLRGLGESAEDAMRLCLRLKELCEQFKQRAAGPQVSAKLVELIDLFFAEFALTVRFAEARLNISYDMANEYMKRLQQLGIIQMVPHKKKNRVFYLADVIALLQ